MTTIQVATTQPPPVQMKEKKKSEDASMASAPGGNVGVRSVIAADMDITVNGILQVIHVKVRSTKQLSNYDIVHAY